MFQEGLFQFLTTQSELTAIIGTAVTRKDKTEGVFAVLAPGEVTMPHIVYQRIFGSQAKSFQGANKLQYARFRFSCYAGSYDGATGCVMLARALEDIFATYTGTWPDGTIVEHIDKVMGPVDDSEPIPHGTVYAQHVDYFFAYKDIA